MFVPEISVLLWENRNKKDNKPMSFPRTWESRTRQVHIVTALDPRVRGDDGSGLWATSTLAEKKLFTGIIEEIGRIASLRGPELCVEATTVLEGLAEGDSIAINGACMTAIAFDATTFRVQVSPESFEKTTLGSLAPGDTVNLERAMAANQRLGGHFVQGHVDGMGEVVGMEEQGEFQLWHFRAPAEVARYLIPKGSVAIDGISLTVVNPIEDTFSVAIIPATLEKTVLPQRNTGAKVNMEADMIGKHIYHFMHHDKQETLSMDFLRAHGFAQEK